MQDSEQDIKKQYVGYYSNKDKNYVVETVGGKKHSYVTFIMNTLWKNTMAAKVKFEEFTGFHTSIIKKFLYSY